MRIYIGTNDEYQVGDLSGKHGFLVQGSRGDSHEAMYVDFNLPLFGTNSVVGRSLVIHQVAYKTFSIRACFPLFVPCNPTV